MTNLEQLKIFSKKIEKEYELILSCNDLAAVLENTILFIRKLRSDPITAQFIHQNEKQIQSKKTAFNNAAFEAIEEEFVYRSSLPHATKKYKDELYEFQLLLEDKKKGESGIAHPISSISQELDNFGFPDNTSEADIKASPLKKFEIAYPNPVMNYREVLMQSECELPFLLYRFWLLEEICTFKKTDFFTAGTPLIRETKTTKETRKQSFDLAIKYAHETNLIFACKPIKYSFQYGKLPSLSLILPEYIFSYEDILKGLKILKTRIDIFLMEQNLQAKEELYTPLTKPEKNLTKAIHLIKEAYIINPQAIHEQVTDHVLDRENPPPYVRSKIPKIIREYKLDPRTKKVRGLGKKSKTKKQK